MCPSRSFLLFLLWFEVAQNEWWNGYQVGYGAEACLDLYSQYCTSTCDQPTYDYNQYFQLGYPTSYSQPIIYDYQYYSYNPYQDHQQQQPVIIILNNEDRDDDWDLFDIISLITSLKDKPNEPVYIPYPVPVSNCGCNSDYDFDWDSDCHSNCGCRNKGKCNTCKNDRCYCDCNCDDCSDHRKRGRSKSKSHCSGNSRSTSDRGRCNKCESIKHKCDCCY